MAVATFRFGEPLMADYTAGSNLAAGAIVALNDCVGITHLPINNGNTGALAIHGGVYKINAAGNYQAGAKVYWNATAAALTTNGTTTLAFGFLLAASVTATTVDALHHPF